VGGGLGKSALESEINRETRGGGYYLNRREKRRLYLSVKKNFKSGREKGFLTKKGANRAEKRKKIENKGNLQLGCSPQPKRTWRWGEKGETHEERTS